MYQNFLSHFKEFIKENQRKYHLSNSIDNNLKKNFCELFEILVDKSIDQSTNPSLSCDKSNNNPLSLDSNHPKQAEQENLIYEKNENSFINPAINPGSENKKLNETELSLDKTKKETIGEIIASKASTDETLKDKTTTQEAITQKEPTHSTKIEIDQDMEELHKIMKIDDQAKTKIEIDKFLQTKFKTPEKYKQQQQLTEQESAVNMKYIDLINKFIIENKIHQSFLLEKLFIYFAKNSMNNELAYLFSKIYYLLKNKEEILIILFDNLMAINNPYQSLYALVLSNILVLNKLFILKSSNAEIQANNPKEINFNIFPDNLNQHLVDLLKQTSKSTITVTYNSTDFTELIFQISNKPNNLFKKIFEELMKCINIPKEGEKYKLELIYQITYNFTQLIIKNNLKTDNKTILDTKKTKETFRAIIGKLEYASHLELLKDIITNHDKQYFEYLINPILENIKTLSFNFNDNNFLDYFKNTIINFIDYKERILTVLEIIMKQNPNNTELTILQQKLQ